MAVSTYRSVYRHYVLVIKKQKQILLSFLQEK